MDVSDCGAVGTATVQQGSDDVGNVELCAQCQESELSVVSSTFCSECNDFLCDDCVDQHRKLRASKKHNLLEGNDVPKKKPRVTRGNECAEHPGETIKLYCRNDHVLGCVLCITESHRNCPDVTSISKLSRDIGLSKELTYFKLSIEKQNAEFLSCKQILDEYHVLNDKWYTQSVEEFETFKAKIEALLDSMGKEVYSQAGELKERNSNKMKSLTELLKSIKQEIESLKHDIEWRETTRQTEKLFIEVKRGIKYIDENVKKLEHIKDDIHIQRYKFNVNQNLQKLLDEMTNTGFNPLKVMSGDLNCTADIYIKSPADTVDCSISGLAEISHDEIMVTDYKNKCLKLVHVDSKTIVQRRPLMSRPYDVTFIPVDARVAVTVPDKHEIQFFSADKQIVPCGSISVDGECVAVQYSKGTLIVCFWDPMKVQTIDLEGVILRSFTSDTAGNQLFEEPNRLCVSPDHAAIYVSDNWTTLTCVSVSNGQISWKSMTTEEAYDDTSGDEDDSAGVNINDNPDDKDGDTADRNDEAQSDEDYWNVPSDEEENEDTGFYPRGLASGDDGCLYVCSDKTDSIHVVSPAGIRLRVIPVGKFKLFEPDGVCYSKSRDALYVRSSSSEPEDCNFLKRLSFTNSE